MNLQSAIAYVDGDYGPSLGAMANIFFRVLLNLTAAVSCWIPLKLFHKKGELAGTSMVVALALLNLFYAVNTMLWPTDDMALWPKAYGWCDIQLVLWVPLETLNAAAICAVMQNIANQVSLLRASGLTCEEKRRKRIIQALILFPVPVLQLVLYYFVIAMRYNISGIIGCQAVFDPDWIFLLSFVLPCPLFAMAAAYYAGLTWIRYRKIDTVSRKALLCAGNSGNQARAARTKRKLYLMALTIVVPYFPMQMIFLFNNIRLGLPWTKPYDLGQLHSPGWDRLDYAPSTSVSFTSMYINYIAVLEVIVFFIYFGRTKEAHEMYREYLRALGLGKIFPRLNEEWRPSDKSSPTTFKTLWSRAKSVSSSFTHTHGSSSSNTSPGGSFTKRYFGHDEDSQLVDIRLRSLDLEAARSTLDALPASSEAPHQLPRRNPWLFRTTLELPKVPVPAFLASKRRVGSDDEIPSQASLGSMVALLGSHPRPTASSGGDHFAKAKRSRENVRVAANWGSENLPGTYAVRQHVPGLSDARTIHGNVARSQMLQIDKRYPVFLTAAYMPKRGVRGSHGSCACENDSADRALQRARLQADFERGLISIRRDFASR